MPVPTQNGGEGGCRPQDEPLCMLPEFLWLSVLGKADNRTVPLAHPCHTERTGLKVRI